MLRFPVPSHRFSFRLHRDGRTQERKAKVDFFFQSLWEKCFCLPPHIRTTVIFFILFHLCLSVHESLSREQGSFSKVKLFYTSLVENSPGHDENSLSRKYVGLDARGLDGPVSLWGVAWNLEFFSFVFLTAKHSFSLLSMVPQELRENLRRGKTWAQCPRTTDASWILLSHGLLFSTQLVFPVVVKCRVL